MSSTAACETSVPVEKHRDRAWWGRRLVGALGLTVGRSLFPIAALLIIGGTLWWGPWVSLAVAVLWFGIVLRIG